MTQDAHLNSLGMTGDYNNHSAPQRLALEPTFNVLDKAISAVCSRVEFDGAGIFNVVDYGSSHGGNSLKPMSIIIEAVRKYASSKQPIAIYHTDLPHNDYNTLFRTLHEADNSYMKASSLDAPILSYATATPFFQQILPSSSVHFGFSSSAAHWLSCFPGEIKHLYAVAAPEPERAVWKKQAAVDWTRFLAARSKELAPGGTMVLANLFMDDTGDFTTKELSIIMDNIILEMQARHIVGAKSAHKFSHPSYFRTQKEYTSPLQEHGLALRDAFSRKIQNPLYQRYSQSGDWVEFGEAMVNWAKQWCHVALLRVIGQLDEDAKQEASDYFYRRVAEEVTKNPHDHQIIMVMLYLVIEKNIMPAVAQS